LEQINKLPELSPNKKAVGTFPILNKWIGMTLLKNLRNNSPITIKKYIETSQLVGYREIVEGL